MIHLDYRDSRPIYTQIIDGFREQIATGVLQPGEKLPSVRELAAALTINPNTIQRSYRQLEVEGWIATVPGKGCFVSARNQDFYLEEQQKKIEELFIQAIDTARASGIKLDKLIGLLTLLYEEE